MSDDSGTGRAHETRDTTDHLRGDEESLGSSLLTVIRQLSHLADRRTHSVLTAGRARRAQHRSRRHARRAHPSHPKRPACALPVATRPRRAGRRGAGWARRAGSEGAPGEGQNAQSSSAPSHFARPRPPRLGRASVALRRWPALRVRAQYWCHLPTNVGLGDQDQLLEDSLDKRGDLAALTERVRGHRATAQHVRAPPRTPDRHLIVGVQQQLIAGLPAMGDRLTQNTVESAGG